MDLTAKPIPKRRRVNGTGLESILDFAAVMVVILSGISAVWFVVFIARVDPLTGLVLCLSIASIAFVSWLLLRSLAELIRLQKRNAGLEYSGKITGSQYDVVNSCSNCGNMLHSEVACDVCGARIEKPDDDEPLQDGTSS
ncbi:MAG: hypothetical protein WBD20_06855 [Pirellulaceae bacterium]